MSCFGGRTEQIYLIEALIDTLALTNEKATDIGEARVVIKLKFLDLPTFEITREDFDSIRPAPRAPDGSYSFWTGRSCLFVRQPKDLVRELRAAPVKVGVFRAGDTYPIAETDIVLPGCLCDQVAMSSNDPANLPKPFTVRGGFHLLDPGENPSGTLDMELRLTSFGRSITTKYEMRSEFFLFRNQDGEREFRVARAIPPDYCADAVQRDAMKCGDGMVPETAREPEPVATPTVEKSAEKAVEKKGRAKDKKLKGRKRK